VYSGDHFIFFGGRTEQIDYYDVYRTTANLSLVEDYQRLYTQLKTIFPKTVDLGHQPGRARQVVPSSRLPVRRMLGWTDNNKYV